MPVISAYSTSGSSYISPSYRYRSSLSDRKSYTTSSSTSSSIYRRSSYRYELPSTSSAYSSYRSDRTTDAELSATLSTLGTKDTAVESNSSPVTAATSTTVNSTSRPSRYSTAYSYSTLSSAPTRDYSTRFSSRSSDTRLKDRENNCLCTGGAGSSSNYISNLRSTALSGADIYQKYSVSTYKPSSLESRISSRTIVDSVAKSPTSIANSATLKASSPTTLDITKVNNIPTKDKNSNINIAVVISNNNNTTNTSNGLTSVANNPLPVTNCKLSTARNTGAKPENLARFPNSHSETSIGITGTTVVTTTTTTITTTTSSTSVLLSSSSSSSVLYETAAVSLDATRSRKPGSVPAVLKNTLNKLRPSGGKPPVPKSAFTSSSSSDLSSASAASGRKELLGLSSYRNQNFLKHECDLVKRELSKSATEIAFKKGSNQTAPNKPVTIGSATSLLSSADDSKDKSSSILSKLEVSKVRQLLPPVASSSKVSKTGQPKDHEDDDVKNHQHNNQNATTTTTITTTSNRSQPSSAKQPFTSSTSTSGVELKPIDRPAVSTVLQSTQRNDTSLFKSSPLPSNTCTITTTRTTTITTTATTESLTSACMPSSSSSAVRTTACTYPTNSRSATDAAMKSLHITTELEESITQATIKLRPTVNGTSNGTAGGHHRLIATASSTTDDMVDNDYHHVTATIRIKPKSSISHHSTSSSSSSSSTNGSTASINNINNNNNNNANNGGHGSSSDDEHELPNGNVSIYNNNNNKNNNSVEGDGNDDVSEDDDVNDTATVGINSVDKESKVNDDDRRVSYLRSGTASKSIHSTSPVGYRSRDYDSGIGSYRSGLGNSSSSASVQKPSYNDRTNGEESTGGGSRKEGLCGLWNIGNTCFMNSVIQCLSHTRELTNFLRMQPTSERGTTKDHKILAEYTKLIKDMWNGTNRSVNPSELKYAFSSKHRMYSGSAQQDAQEFLRFFIDSLHSALNVSIKREPISREIEDDDLNNRIKATMMWEWYSKVENSMIKDLFVGLLRSTLKCTVCNSASVTFDPFWDLSLPLPSTNSRCKLENCLDMFVKEEVMDGIDQPTCSKCKTRRKCTKSFTIERFPKYLVIHLKRFSETRWSKLTNVIEFPTGERELNLQPYASEDNTAPVYYSLYGISNHMGSTAGGHYVAVCKHPVSKEWHEFNDNFVSETSERSLVTSSAYVLFYERA